MSNKREVIALVKHLESEGARAEWRRGNKYQLVLKDGSTTTLHTTLSDPRSWKNARAFVIRAGHSWPGDKRETKETMRLKSEKANRTAIEQAIELLHGDGVAIRPAQIVDLTGLPHTTAVRHLQHMGYSPDPDSKYNREWRQSWATPEIDRASEHFVTDDEETEAEAIELIDQILTIANAEESVIMYQSTDEVIDTLREQGVIDDTQAIKPVVDDDKFGDLPLLMDELREHAARRSELRDVLADVDRKLAELDSERVQVWSRLQDVELHLRNGLDVLKLTLELEDL